MIYRLFADDPARFTVDSVDPGAIDFVNIGVDFGGNRSRTTFAAAAFLRHGGIAVIGEHAVAGGKGEIDSSRINGEFGSFLGKLRQAYPDVRVKYVFADSEAQYLINGLRRYVQENDGGIRVMDCAKRPIVDRIAFVNTLMSSGRFRLTKDCVLLKAGLASAVWDENADGDKRLDNFSTDIDILDAFEYAVERYMMSMK